MKIALVSPYDFPYPGGVTEHVAALAAGLQQRGHEVQIFAASSGFPGYDRLNYRIMTRQIVTVPIAGALARIGFSPLTFITVKKMLRQEKFDIVHLQEPLTPSLTWWFLMLASAQTTTVGTFHAYHEQPHWLYRLGRPLFKRLFAKLDSLIAVSPPARQFAGGMFPGNYRIIPNGIDLRRFGRPMPPLPSKPKQKINLLFVGRLDPRKGFAVLFEAFCRLQTHYPHLKLQVIGPVALGTMRMYRHMAQARGITGLEFIGYIAPDRLPDFYHQADIFCAPSLGCESFGIVLLEAMAAGLPIVASDITGYRSLLTSGQEGLLVPPGQPDSLTSALRRLIDQPDLRRRLGQSGQAKAAHFAWDHVVDQTLAVYNDTIWSKIGAGAVQAMVKDDSEAHVQRRQANYVQ
ncbi:MAG: glycosyltransferase family 4 protein [Anaerolineaceae bacterium]|nr:glycosyltransferase family 4 protein [Anaerolineaceae bacterium]